MNMLAPLFSGEIERRQRWLGWTSAAGLYLIGLFAWGVYLGWGTIQFDFHDWGEITVPRLTFLQNAIQEGKLPLHMLSLNPLGGATDRFLCVPDQILSPQVVLLGVLSVAQFIFFDILLMYSIGFIGLLLIRHKYKLSVFSFSLLFFLFTFNGHILAHITAGHASWGGYFLFPYFFLLVVELLEDKAGWVWVAKTALLLFTILLQGSYHQFVWLLYFLGFLALAVPRHFWTILKSGLFAILFSMVRLLPPILILKRFNSNYFGGYPTLASIWDSMVYSLIPAIHTNWDGLSNSVGTWEFSLYTGLLAGLFLVYFGILRTFRSTGEEKVLLAPAVGIILLSMEEPFRVLRTVLTFPPFTGERIASRSISLAFVVVLFLAVIAFQHWLEAGKLTQALYLPLLVLSLININDLWENFYRWEVTRNIGTFEPFFLIKAEDWLVANHHDTKYLLMLGAGLAVTVMSSIYLIVKIRQTRHDPRASQAARLSESGKQVALKHKTSDHGLSGLPR